MIYFSNKMHDCHAFHIREDQPIPEEFPVHAHMVRIELFCILSGKLRYHVEGNTYHPQPGDLLMSAPGETHRVELDPSVPYERMVVIFDPQMLSGLDPEGKLTEAERDELLLMATDGAKDSAQIDIYEKIVDLEHRVVALENKGKEEDYAIWVSGYTTNKGETVRFDYDGDGVLDLLRYDGGRSYTSLSFHFLLHRRSYHCLHVLPVSP